MLFINSIKIKKNNILIKYNNVSYRLIAHLGQLHTFSNLYINNL